MSFTEQLIAQVAMIGRDIPIRRRLVAARVKSLPQHSMQFIREETSTLPKSNSANGTMCCLRSTNDAQDVTVHALRDRRYGALQTDRTF